MNFIVRSSIVAALASAAFACSSPPPARAPLQMVKIETSPGGGAHASAPLALHSEIDATSSANDLDNSGPKISEPPKEKAKSEAKFAAPDQHVGLSKHSAVPVGGNLHGYR